MNNPVIVFSTAEYPLAVIYPTGAVPIEEVLERDVPMGVVAKVVSADALPNERFFRDAWRLSKAGEIEVDLAAAKAVGHAHRRNQRALKFEPLDAQIARQIPGTDLTALEAARAVIREEDAAVQAAIDAAETPAQILSALRVYD